MSARRAWPEPSFLAGHRAGAIRLCGGARAGGVADAPYAGMADEAVILSTCNRVEIYTGTALEPAQAFEALQHFLATDHDYRDPLREEIYTLSEPHSV